jgi:hypothetical protein
MVATRTAWTCPFCATLIEAPTLEDRWNHAIDRHLAELKAASAQTLAQVTA